MATIPIQYKPPSSELLPHPSRSRLRNALLFGSTKLKAQDIGISQKYGPRSHDFSIIFSRLAAKFETFHQQSTLPFMNPNSSTSARHHTQWWLSRLFIFLVVSRLLLLIFAPHNDPSESRYAEISRKMVETGNWVTPQFDYGVPFWGKPPLSMWMSALGIEIFGPNQFSSRIFIFLASMVVLALAAKAAHREYGKKFVVAAATILMGMPLFFDCSAAVMTDLALALGATLAMVAFRQAVLTPSKAWGVLAVVGIVPSGVLHSGPQCHFTLSVTRTSRLSSDPGGNLVAALKCGRLPQSSQ